MCLSIDGVVGIVGSSLVLGPQFTCQGCNSSTWKNDCLYFGSGILSREEYFSYIPQLGLKNMILNDLKLLNNSEQCFGVEHRFCKAPEVSEGRVWRQTISYPDRKKRGQTLEHVSPFAAIKLEHLHGEESLLLLHLCLRKHAGSFMHCSEERSGSSVAFVVRNETLHPMGETLSCKLIWEGYFTFFFFSWERKITNF